MKILYISFFCFFSAMIPMLLDAQDLYDKKRSEEFAGFLFQTRQYDLAAREYERLYILEQKTVPRLELFKAYRLANQYEQGRARLLDIYKEDKLPKPVFLELTKLQLLGKRFDELHSVTSSQPDVTDVEKKIISYLPALYLPLRKSKKYTLGIESGFEFSDPQWQRLSNKLNEYEQEKWKNPAVAGILSAVVPGAGRLYAGDWKNAIISAVFVSANFYQSYRGFSRNGTSSVSGWIFGGIGLGFYIGNIYGSVWSTNKINEKKRQHYQGVVEQLYFSL